MAATLFRALCFLALIGLTIHCLANPITSTNSNVDILYLLRNSCWSEVCMGRYPNLSSAVIRVNCIWDSRSRIGFCISKWSKHGETVLAIPAHNSLINVTICMDVHPNPGPAVNEGNEHNLGKTSVNDRHFQTTPSFCMGGSVINFSRSQLINLRYESNFPVSSRLLALLKSHMLLKYRGSRAGKKQRIRQIFVQAGHRISYKWNYNRYADFTNLTYIHCLPLSKVNSQKPAVESMTMAYVNCRSINRNGFKLKDCVVDNDYDLIGITETWLPIEQSLSNHIIRDFCPKGYKMVHIPRSSSQRGGGVGILHKDTLDLKITETVNTFASFECIERLLKLDSTWIRVVVVYRPPVSSVNALSVSMFLSEFSVYLENLVLLPGEVLIMGDFNFHTDDLTNHNACEFSHLLDTFNMSQHVSEPTHQPGHTLDLLITRQDSNLYMCPHTLDK